MAKSIHIISKGLHIAAQIILAIMMLLITVDAFSRYIFRNPIKGSVELTEIGLALIVFFGLAYTNLKKEHITIDFVVEKFSKRVQTILEIITQLVVIAIMILVSWSMYENAMRLHNSGTTTGDLGLPIYLFCIIAIAGTIVYTLTAILFAVESIMKVGKIDES